MPRKSRKPGSKPRIRTRYHGEAWLSVPPPMDYTHLQGRRIAFSEAARLVGCSQRSLERWQRGELPIPTAELRLLQIHAYGILPHHQWREWQMTPDGHIAYWCSTTKIAPLLPAELCHRTLLLELEAEIRRQRDQLRLDVAALELEITDAHGRFARLAGLPRPKDLPPAANDDGHPPPYVPPSDAGRIWQAGTKGRARPQKRP